jgi:hypothetical protein
MSAGAGSAATRSIGQWADDAVQAVRVLDHRTRPATGELTDPADPAEVIAGLAALAGMLPQLLDQLAGWLLDQQCGDDEWGAR